MHLNKTPRFHGLDNLRALAIILVVLCHYYEGFGYPEWLGKGIRFGFAGVDLFFVLSGFLISSQLFTSLKNGEGVIYKTFFIKRFFRIIPAFWAVLTIYFCFPFFHEREVLPPLWRFLSFTQNLGLNIRQSGTFSHAWSLCVEEHFYLALPLILIAMDKTKLLKAGPWLIAILFVAGFALRHYSWAHLYLPHASNMQQAAWHQYMYYPTYNRLDGLLAGVSIAAVYVFAPKAWHNISRYGNQILLLALVLLSGAYIVFLRRDYTSSVFGFPLVAIGCGALVMSAVSPTSLLYKWQSKTTALIATLSYGIYLTHKGVLHMTQQAAEGLGLDLDSNLVLLLCAVACLLFAGVLYIAVERPFMRLRGKILDRGKAKIAIS